MPQPNYTRAQALPAILANRIAILDGAMGTMIQRLRLGEAQYRGARFRDFHKDVKGNNELLSLTRPDVIGDIHEKYLAAGADLIETNTFGATTVAQADYDMADLAREMTVASARIARTAAKGDAGAHPYAGYEMVAFPDSADRQSPMIGYLPGQLPWFQCEELKAQGLKILNTKITGATHVDRKLVSGDSPMACDDLGKMIANTLLDELAGSKAPSESRAATA